jgi:hypothetical protein
VRYVDDISLPHDRTKLTGGEFSSIHIAMKFTLQKEGNSKIGLTIYILLLEIQFVIYMGTKVNRESYNLGYKEVAVTYTINMMDNDGIPVEAGEIGKEINIIKSAAKQNYPNSVIAKCNKEQSPKQE